jgi:hypothetical protein
LYSGIIHVILAYLPEQCNVIVQFLPINRLFEVGWCILLLATFYPYDSNPSHNNTNAVAPEPLPLPIPQTHQQQYKPQPKQQQQQHDDGLSPIANGPPTNTPNPNGDAERLFVTREHEVVRTSIGVTRPNNVPSTSAVAQGNFSMEQVHSAANNAEAYASVASSNLSGNDSHPSDGKALINSDSPFSGLATMGMRGTSILNLHSGHTVQGPKAEKSEQYPTSISFVPSSSSMAGAVHLGLYLPEQQHPPPA